VAPFVYVTSVRGPVGGGASERPLSLGDTGLSPASGRLPASCGGDEASATSDAFEVPHAARANAVKMRSRTKMEHSGP